MNMVFLTPHHQKSTKTISSKIPAKREHYYPFHWITPFGFKMVKVYQAWNILLYNMCTTPFIIIFISVRWMEPQRKSGANRQAEYLCLITIIVVMYLYCCLLNPKEREISFA